MPLKELMSWFKYTKNELHHKYFSRCSIDNNYVLRFLRILRTLILWNSLQLTSTGCQDSLIKSTQHATLLLKVAML